MSTNEPPVPQSGPELTRERIEAIRTAPWSAYDLVHVHKDNLEALCSMALAYLLESEREKSVREKAKGSARKLAEDIFHLGTATGWANPDTIEIEQAAEKIQAWHESKLPVVTENAKALIEPVMDLAVEAHQIACRMTRKEATLDDVIQACDATAAAVNDLPSLISQLALQAQEKGREEKKKIGFRCPRGNNPCRQIGCNCHAEWRKSLLGEDRMKQPKRANNWDPQAAQLPQDQRDAQAAKAQDKAAFNQWRDEE